MMGSSELTFSLVLCTIGRTLEVEAFLKSLAAQDYDKVQLIIVDQNEDDRILEISSRYSTKIPIMHIRSKPGLSRARNVGLGLVSGDIVGFPDDDCEYPVGLLRRVSEMFSSLETLAGVTGRSIGYDGGGSIGRFEVDQTDVTREKIWTCGISFTIFIRRSVVLSAGLFDENLGVGAATPWGAGEETDYLLRILSLGFTLRYFPSLTVVHPPANFADGGLVSKMRLYGAGMGYVARRHKLPWKVMIPFFARPILGCVLSLLTGRRARSLLYYNSFVGRIRGYRMVGLSSAGAGSPQRGEFYSQ
jgi:glycosyltransferase involved in cell wall biosynthesis